MDRKRNEIARSLSMVTQLGISMLAPLILCVCVGIWLDDTFVPCLLEYLKIWVS